jgi:hypothetical protein
MTAAICCKAAGNPLPMPRPAFRPGHSGQKPIRLYNGPGSERSDPDTQSARFERGAHRLGPRSNQVSSIDRTAAETPDERPLCYSGGGGDSSRA